MPFAGDWSPIGPEEILSLSITFEPRLAPGDTIASVVSRTLSVFAGKDPNVASILSGSAVIDTSRLIVSQKVGPNCVPGTGYKLTIVVLTTNGETRELYGRVSCELSP